MGLAAGGRRPSESADPRGPACGAMQVTLSDGGSVSKRVYRGRGILPPVGLPLALWGWLWMPETEFSCKRYLEFYSGMYIFKNRTLKGTSVTALQNDEPVLKHTASPSFFRGGKRHEGLWEMSTPDGSSQRPTGERLPLKDTVIGELLGNLENVPEYLAGESWKPWKRWNYGNVVPGPSSGRG